MTLVWGGDIDENLIGAITTVDRTRLDHALEWLKQEANVARRELEELNKLPSRNPLASILWFVVSEDFYSLS